MSNEAEQIAQRQAKLDELVRLGVPPYPNAFDRTATVIGDQGRRTTPSTGEALEASRPQVRVAGRILGMRSFGKANFLVLSDGLERLQVYVRADSVPDARLRDLQAARFRRSRRRRRAACSAPRPTSSRSGRRACISWPSACCRCRRSGTG